MLGIDGVDVGDCSFGIYYGLFGGLVSDVFWGEIGVHAYAADEGALALLETDGGEEVGRGDVEGCEVGGCCCAVGEGAGYAAGVDTAGEGE